jgi:hypothetical protein
MCAECAPPRWQVRALQAQGLITDHLSGGQGDGLGTKYRPRHTISIRTGTLNWLRFTYDSEIGSA